MTAALGIVSLLLLGRGGGDAASPGLLDCLRLLIVVVLLPLLAYLVLTARSFLKHPGKDKPEVTSIRSQGKTIVNAPPDDDTGSVN